MKTWKWLFWIPTQLLALFLVVNSARAQITPDLSMPIPEQSILNTGVVVPGGSGDRITGGAVRGVNLFHSFQEFNVNDLQRVYFNNPSGIINILSRVRGTNPSSILGTLGVDGPANLFLINPNGIFFGPNANLDVSGSFLASTAPSLQFSNGAQFRTDTNAVPAVTINIPIGPQFGAFSPAILRVDPSPTNANLSVGGRLSLSSENVEINRPLIGQAVALGTPTANPIRLNTDRIQATTSGIQLNGNVQIDAPAVNLIGNTVIAGTVNGQSTGNQALQVTGNVEFANAVGNTTPLRSLSVSGNTIANGDITTTLSQTYGGTVNLFGDRILQGNAIVFNNAVTGNQSLRIFGNTTTNGDITTATDQVYDGTLSLGGDRTLQGTNVTFNDTVNGNQSLRVIGNSTVLGNVSTGTTQTYDGTVNLLGDRTLQGTTVTFNGVVAGGDSLTVNGNTIASQNITTGTSQTYRGSVNLVGDRILQGTTITFAGPVVGTQSLRVIGNTIAQDDITTSTIQTYDGTVNLVGDRTFQGTTITFNDTVTGDQSLTVNGNTIARGNIDTVANQTYNGTVNLEGDRTLQANTVTFNSAVNDDQSLTVNGNTIARDNITTATTQTYNGSLNLEGDRTLQGTTVEFGGLVNGDQSLTVNGNTIARDNITTATNQTYNGMVNLEGDRTLTGSTVTFNNTVTGNQSLAVTGNTITSGDIFTTTSQTYNGPVNLVGNRLLQGTTVTFNDAVNGNQSLVIAGNTIARGDITTASTQTYTGTVTLEGERVLTGSTIEFGNAVNGNQSLIVAGNAIARGDITTGTTQLYTSPLALDGNRTLQGTAITFNNDVTGNQSLRVIGNTTTSGNITTGTTQTYDGVVNLVGDRTLQGTTITFNNPVNGNQSLTVIGNTIARSNITTGARQTYTGTVNLEGDRILTGNDFDFQNDVIGNGQTLRIQPFTNGRAIALNNSSSPTSVNLSPIELNRLRNFSTVTIGNTTTGTLTVGDSNPVDLTSNPQPYNLVLNANAIQLDNSLTLPNSRSLIFTRGSVAQTNGIVTTENLIFQNTGSIGTSIRPIDIRTPLVTSQVNGDLHLRSDQGIRFGSTTVSGNLSAIAQGNISQAAAITQTGSTATFTTLQPGSTIRLDHPQNAIDGIVHFASAGDVTFTNSTNTRLGTSAVGGQFSVTSDREIATTGSMATNGHPMTLLAKNGDITVNAAGTWNTSSLTMTAVDGNVTLNDGTISFNNGNPGNLKIEAASPNRSIRLNNFNITGSATSGTTPGGNATLVASQIELQNNSSMNTSTIGKSGSGNLNLGNDETEKITLDNSHLTARVQAATSSSSDTNQPTGVITLQAKTIDLNRGEIRTKQEHPANTIVNFTILLKTDTLQINNESKIVTEGSSNARGGDINVLKVKKASANNSGPNGSDIIAGNGGTGGEVVFKPSVFKSPQFRLQKAIPGNGTNDIDGTGDLNAAINTIQLNREVAPPPKQAVDGAQLVSDMCQAIATQPNQSSSELKITGRGGVPPNPTDPLPADIENNRWIDFWIQPETSVSVVWADGQTSAIASGESFHLKTTCRKLQL